MMEPLRTPPPRAGALALLQNARALAAQASGPGSEKFRACADLCFSERWTVLVSGLCSVGKSSFVSALWGDARMLPTAVRDCTQTNTLIRVPNGEPDRRLRLSHLTRARALDYAVRDLSCFRLEQFLNEVNGPLSIRLDEQPPEERLRLAVSGVRKIFTQRPDLFILHEPLTEELDKLDQFLQFIDSDEYHPGETTEARWDDRREHLMGRRRPDGRTLDAGHLLALEHVEVVRASGRWAEASPPVVIDSPWIPAYHNARRADLILAQARTADILVILALPDRFEPEPWVAQILNERPELSARTLVVFNQADTVDSLALFARDGFASAFQENTERLCKLGLNAENFFISCARLPFLELNRTEGLAAEFIPKIKKVLERLSRLASGRTPTAFTRRLLDACDPAGAGLETVRRRLTELWHTQVSDARALNALKAMHAVTPLDVPSGQQTAWQDALHASSELQRCFRPASRNF